MTDLTTAPATPVGERAEAALDAALQHGAGDPAVTALCGIGYALLTVARSLQQPAQQAGGTR
ncbi:hypothetical protein Ppa06_64690 [Planomonospora parontospora subsp. parontospora]|uniref:Uncharacterized protein n=2 Tax=Planomonospora parontospora TaxID=58119 RepID=A0AA37F832_9ACTN|nr:hypothetical protein [Planomonospora parontospora]GGK94304.1 hypothetical protein GCM10010126_62150 [Planomonospora parontospora]GII12671.1 hypothetical protein Ppa06_64690 [Planomonospora parontospora subsp. parontospora]